MPTETTQRLDFRGGISRLRRQNQNEIFLCQNARCQGDGSIVVRNGQLEHISISGTGSIERLFVKHSGNLGLQFYSIQRSGDPDDDCYTDDTKMTGPNLGKSDYCSIAEYKGVIFFSNGVGPINYHETGTSVRAEVTGTPTPPKGKHMLIYKDRMYIAGEDGNLYWSDVGVYTTLPEVDFPALNFQKVGGINDPITGLVVGENFLIAFTSGTYQIMTGTPDDDGGLGDMNWQVYNNIGTRASRSVTSQGKKIPFLGIDRRMYMLEGTVLTDIDPLDHVKEYLNAFSDSVLRVVSCSFNGDELWLSVPIGYNESSSIVLVYNTVLENWVVFSNITSFSLYFSKSAGKLFTGGAATSKIYEQGNGAIDPGNSLIPLEFITRQEVLGTLRKIKKYGLFNIQIDMKQGESVSVYYALDNSSLYTEFGVGSPITPTGAIWGAEVWGVAVWGSGITLQNKFLHPVSGGKGVRGTELKIKISGDVSPGTKILGYELDGEVEQKDNELL